MSLTILQRRRAELESPEVSSPATDAAVALLNEFVQLGMRHIVVCPGSRSQAFALVAAALDRKGLVTVHVRTDERVAGFTALGIAKETKVPVAVIVTSGTAVANLMPAVLEAHHSAIPLVLLTADRPPELRGVGANQTTKQPGMFSAFVRFDTDAPVPTEASDASRFQELARAAWAGAHGVSPGPVHVNLPVREPLFGSLPAGWEQGSTGAPMPDGIDTAGAMYQGGGGVGDFPEEEENEADRWPAARTLMVCGENAGPAAVRIAQKKRWPLIAEIVSGARAGANIVERYREKLRDPKLANQIERVIVFGHPTLSREVADLLANPAIEVVAVPYGGDQLNLNGNTMIASEEQVRKHATRGDAEWLERWTAPVSGLKSASSVLDREALVEEVWEASGSEDRLVFGASRLVRVADEVLAPRSVRVYANRGLSGIDGTISTAIGVAAARKQQSGVTRVLLGDLAFLHDVGALGLSPDDADVNVQIVVGNDGGGSIFDQLEVASQAHAEDFSRVQFTPHTVRFEHLALAYGWEYSRVTSRAALRGVLRSPGSGRHLIEVPLQR